MTTMDLRVIVLAAQRRGVIDPLATRFGVSHKCLAPLRGRPLIAHVMDTLAGCPGVGSIAVSVEAEAFEPVRGTLPATGTRIDLVPAADNIADSVIAAASGHGGPLLITTADNALLTRDSVQAMHAALRKHDAAIAMARREAVLAAHPDGQRRFYRFRDGEFSNCNLYGIGNPLALHAAEIFRGGGQFAKKASRIVDAFGLANLILLRLRVLTLDGGLKRISRRIGLGVVPVILPDGSQAIDVDNDRTYGVVDELLGGSAAQRGGEVAEHELALAAGYRP